MTLNREYQICKRCIMDTTDPEIVFDDNGICNHCRDFESILQKNSLPAAKRQARLNKLVEQIKSKGKGKDYDCVIGVSGGVDSTYVAYWVKKLGLRPLAVHVDNGWNSELAVSNIEKVLKRLDIDLKTYVLDWEEFKDLQIAFLKASVPDGEIPTDHAIQAALYKTALKWNVSYILLGTNLATEAILPKRWSYGTDDWRYIRNVYRLFGKHKTLKHFPHYSYLDMIYYLVARRIKVTSILDYLDYKKQEAMQILENELDWRPYGGKHYESIYTRFFQGYILPKKFNIDKRKAHLSTLIISGQITRDQAIEEIKRPTYAGYEQEEDMEYVIKKFEFTEETFNQIISLPVKNHQDYPTYRPFRNLVKKFGVRETLMKLGLVSG